MIFGNKHKQEIEKLKLQVALLSAKQTVMELEARLREERYMPLVILRTMSLVRALNVRSILNEYNKRVVVY